MSIKLLYNCFLIYFDLYKEYNSCLISSLSLFELFPAFDWAKEIGNLLSLWFGVSIFSPCLFRSADSSLSKSGMSVVSGCSPDFLADFCIAVIIFF